MSLQEQMQRDMVAALYAATGKGDWETAESYLTDDFLVSEGSALPYAGVYRGKGGLRELYTKVMTVMDVAALDVHGTTVGGDLAVTLLDLVLAGSDAVRVPIAEMFRFRDGKICEIRPYYFDPNPVVAAVRGRQKR